MPTDYVTIAILAKQKGHLLPYFLKLIENQTYPSSLIKLYIRTNNNTDNTAEVLEEWIERVKDKYSEIHYDNSDVPERVQDYSPHAWNSLKLTVLKRIRQDSIEWAKERKTHYFVVDCDNFIVPDTLETLLQTNLPVIGPLLLNGDTPGSFYSNYHFVTDQHGYYKSSPLYHEVLFRHIKGLIDVEVIHCTYLVRNEVLPSVSYIDETDRYDYVVFSHTLRKAGIPQYIDNRKVYGKLTFTDTEEDFKALNITLE